MHRVNFTRRPLFPVSLHFLFTIDVCHLRGGVPAKVHWRNLYLSNVFAVKSRYDVLVAGNEEILKKFYFIIIIFFLMRNYFVMSRRGKFGRRLNVWLKTQIVFFFLFCEFRRQIKYLSVELASNRMRSEYFGIQ